MPLPALQADLTSRRWLGVPLVLAGAVEGLGEAVRGGKLPLARASLLTLAILADTDIGRHRIVSGPLLPWLIATLEPAVATPSSAHATGRLLEVVAQHDDGAARLVALGVPAALVTLCAAYLPRHGRGAPCVPALGTLSHLRRNAGHGASVIAALEPLAELDVSSVGEHEAREALATLLASMGLGRMPSPSSPSARSSAATPRSPVFA